VSPLRRGGVSQYGRGVFVSASRRVQLRRAWWEPEEADVLWMHYLLGAMAWRAVEDDEKVVIGVSLFESWSNNTSRHPSSIPGRYIQNLSPLVGSTAAYS
jgi:hypothetical protein